MEAVVAVEIPVDVASARQVPRHLQSQKLRGSLFQTDDGLFFSSSCIAQRALVSELTGVDQDNVTLKGHRIFRNALLRGRDFLQAEGIGESQS